MPSSRRAPPGAFSHVHQTRPVERPPVWAWIRERAFSFPCGREADAPRPMETTQTMTQRQTDSRRRGGTGRRGKEKFSKSLSDFGFGGEYGVGTMRLRAMDTLRRNPTATCIAKHAPSVSLSGLSGPQMNTHGGRFFGFGAHGNGKPLLPSPTKQPRAPRGNHSRRIAWPNAGMGTCSTIYSTHKTS